MCTLPLSAPLHALLTRLPGFASKKSITKSDCLPFIQIQVFLPSLSPPYRYKICTIDHVPHIEYNDTIDCWYLTNSK